MVGYHHAFVLFLKDLCLTFAFHRTEGVIWPVY
ncbi:hypothetical protein KO116_03319 [Halomonas sp. KO116]|nr:hypothetical protein KO116_03319 [Halomonas sp. KO116]